MALPANFSVMPEFGPAVQSVSIRAAENNMPCGGSVISRHKIMKKLHFSNKKAPHQNYATSKKDALWPKMVT
jgi:hypothetical protein